MRGLEVPGGEDSPDWNSLYLYRGEEVNLSRPVFTGDIFSLNEVDRRVIVLQHPCAIRLDGVNIVPRLLVCEVQKSQFVKPSGWQGNYKQLPLPGMLGEDSDHFSAYFHKPDLIESSTLKRDTRIACLSEVGVNILLQRWLHHNSRVVVPTGDIFPATVEQFEEADLVEEWCDEHADQGIDLQQAEASAHDWLRSDSGNGSSWQTLLQDPQTRGRVRSSLRSELRSKF